MFLRGKISWPWRSPRLLISATLFGLAIIPACTKQTASKASQAIDYYELSGDLINPDGTTAAGARIYLPGTNEPVGRSDTAGTFSLRVEDNQINAIVLSRRDNAGEPFIDDFQLYFESGEGANLLLGRSGFIALADRGAKNLGTLALDKAATIKGNVKFVNKTGGSLPMSGITIVADRSSVKSDKNGAFALTGIATGRTRLYAYGDGTSISTVEVTLPAGGNLTLDFPLLTYGKDVVGGIVCAIAQLGNEKPIVPGLPFQREFRILRTANTRFIRFAPDEQKVTSESTWQPITDRISFNFPAVGANVLYYQFADSSKSHPSQLFSSTVAADPFADSTGIVIGDGSGIVTTRTVTIQIDLPSAATGMRLAENMADLDPKSTLPFIRAVEKSLFTFAIKRSPDKKDSDMEETMPRTLGVQFKSADDTISPVYTASVRLVPFAEDLKNLTLFTIGDGSGIQLGYRAPIKVNLPPNAYEMRMWEEDKVIQNISGDTIIKIGTRDQLQSTFFKVADKLEFVFETYGFKTIFLQFRTQDGLVSSVFRQNVTVAPVKTVRHGFTINGGVALSITRELTLTLNVPDNAAAYKVSEDPVAISSGVYSYLPASKTVLFLAGGTGIRTINLQYFDAAGNADALYTETILIDSFNNDAGHIWIDGHADELLPVTMDPSIRVMFTPPEAAIPHGQVEIIRANMSLQGTPVCAPLQITNSFVPITDHLDFLLVTPGPNAICVRFRNLEGDVGPYLIQNIIYDPFPVNLGGVSIVKDDESKIHVRNVSLVVTIPPRAKQMRIASSAAAITTSPWRELSEDVNWYFAKPGSAGDDRYYEVFVQFITENGEMSTVYTDNALLELFPADELTVDITAGNKTTTTTALNLVFNPPAAATGIKIAESAADLATAPVVSAKERLVFTVNAVTGIKKLFIKYVSADNIESTMFGGTIALSAAPSAS